MCPRIQTFVFLFLWLSCQVSARTFEHDPPQIVKEKTEVHIRCSHDDSSLLIMYWYQQKQDNTALTLIGFGYETAPNYEGDFEQQFKLTRQSVKEGTLTIKSADQSHSAVYFCAAGDRTNLEPAYFGKGTKLTVLETGLEVTKPKSVKILPPSPKECRNEKDKFRKKTLVCVASGFYPDHVEVLWTINGNEAKDGVATDSAAKRVDKFYRITSRLRVLADDYNKPSNNFTCTVKFFDGEKTTLHHTSINGVEGKAAGGLKREDFLKMTNTAKLSYIVLIAKSCFYGLFVVFLVWKLQGSARKFH